MHKILIFLLFSIFINAQEEYRISPHYGNYIVLNGKFMQQDVTYNDLASASSHYFRVLNEEMGLSELSATNKTDTNANGIYTYIYTNGVGINAEPKRLRFDYKVVNWKDNLLVESVKITGDYLLAVHFYVSAFQTTPDLVRTKSGSVILSHGALEDMTFQGNGNTATITVKNRQFKNLADFELYRKDSENYYLKKKLENEIAEKKQDSIQAVNREIYKKQQMQVPEKPSKPIVSQKISDVVYATKKGNDVTLNNSNNRILSAVKECLKDQKNGLFSVFFKDVNAEKPVCENIRKVK